jgi:hypothetical protein
LKINNILGTCACNRDFGKIFYGEKCKDHKLTGGAIALIVVGMVAALAVLTAGASFAYRKRTNNGYEQIN